MGDVIGDMNARAVASTEMLDQLGAKVVKADVPLAEMFGYATDLRSMSHTGPSELQHAI